MNRPSDLDELIRSIKPSPASSAGKAASQQALDHLGESAETALMNLAEIAQYMDKSEEWVAQQAAQRLLLDAEYGGEILYPAFQIDPDTRQARDWVPEMVFLLDDSGISGQSFVLWSSVPSEFFSGRLPAECADDDDFLRTATSDLTSV